MAYRWRGLGDVQLPAAIIGGSVPSSSGLPSASWTSVGIKNILFPTLSGEAAGSIMSWEVGLCI